ncbi:Transposase [Pseudomonas savastanoi pv. nerii]|nr:Transposase [Pseudomonas savastanoi pv. nerii]
MGTTRCWARFVCLCGVYSETVEGGRDHQVHEVESQIVAWHRVNESNCKLAKVPSVGPITASAMVASLSDAKSFKNGIQASA